MLRVKSQVAVNLGITSPSTDRGVWSTRSEPSAPVRWALQRLISTSDDIRQLCIAELGPTDNKVTVDMVLHVHR